MKAGSLPDDELGALRESVSSPSSGEVCLEVCPEHVSLCLHLFFNTSELEIAKGRKPMRKVDAQPAHGERGDGP